MSLRGSAATVATPFPAFALDLRSPRFARDDKYIIIGGNGEAWVVPGDTPKTTSGTPTIGKKKSAE